MARRTQHSDPSNKRLFSHPRMVADLVRLLGDDWVDDLDLDRLQRLPTEPVAGDLRARLADMPWWTPFRPGGGRPAGAGAMLYIEFQSSPDPQMRVGLNISRISAAKKRTGDPSRSWETERQTYPMDR